MQNNGSMSVERICRLPVIYKPLRSINVRHMRNALFA